MTRGRRQEETSDAASGLRILARIIARSLIGRQRETEVRKAEEVDHHKLNAQNTANAKDLDGQATNGEEDPAGDETGGKPLATPRVDGTANRVANEVANPMGIPREELNASE
jgi:hypothetical protein